MNKKYDRLDYVGKARYIVIDVYPHKTGIKISTDNPYVFDKNDVLNEDSIKYYESFYRDGLRLHEAEDTEVISDPIPEDPTDENPKDPVDDNKEINTVSENSDITTEEVQENSQGENQIPEDPTDENPKDQVESEATQEEMIEFLDLTYDDENIKDVARDSGIKRIQGSWDKQTIISKIIENNSQYVINLMKNQ